MGADKMGWDRRGTAQDDMAGDGTGPRQLKRISDKAMQDELSLSSGENAEARRPLGGKVGLPQSRPGTSLRTQAGRGMKAGTTRGEGQGAKEMGPKVVIPAGQPPTARARRMCGGPGPPRGSSGSPAPQCWHPRRTLRSRLASGSAALTRHHGRTDTPGHAPKHLLLTIFQGFRGRFAF